MAIAGLVIGSLYLGVNRIIQVDEAQQVFQSAILARGEQSSFYTYAPIHHLGPMAWIALHAGPATSIFMWNRLLYLLVFWANILLLARICTGAWGSQKFLYWLLFAGTLVPVWDYGFEIRHDNLLLTGLLIFWLLCRRNARWPWVAFSVTGALVVLLQFVAFKAFLYWAPWCMVLLAFPPPSCREEGRLRLFLYLVGGACAGLIGVRIAYALGGGWDVALAGFRGGVSTSASAERFSALPTLTRLSAQAPLLTGLGLAAVIASNGRWRKEGRAFLRWDSQFPELALLYCVMAAFLVNPTPFPYNLLFLAPFILVAGAGLWESDIAPLIIGTPMAAFVAGVLVFCHFMPFLRQTTRHFERANSRQEELMTLAEAMTDPVKDCVFDGTGLVPTRRTIGFHWLVHSLTIQRFRNGTWPSVQAMLTQSPASVIIPNYRTDWLSDSDKGFISSHYVRLADDFLVLGTILQPGGGSWTCLHGGRYQVSIIGKEAQSNSATLQVDGGVVVGKSVLKLSPGLHHLTVANMDQILVVWLGPTLPNLPRLAPGSHGDLFVNWY